MIDGTPFTVARLPRIVFGEGRIAELPAEATAFGPNVLLVTGASAFRESPAYRPVMDGFADAGATVETVRVNDEPTPDLVDDIVGRYHGAGIDVVVAVGGGSPLDTAKAVAGLLPTGRSVMDHLEGVGQGIPYEGPSVPFVACPTTAGTGSEATKNAVLGRRGPEGFKKSFRHECLVPRTAVIDPGLLETVPRRVMAADGMDAFTQCLESLTSTGSTPFTAPLAWAGLEAIRDGFFTAIEDGQNEAARVGRARMHYAALMSGISLAQTGLGAVHGLASPLGAFYPLPHGAVCGTLVAEAVDVNLAALEARVPESPALDVYARAGALLTGRPDTDGATARRALVDTLRDWAERLALPRLSEYGVEESDIPHIVAHSRGSSMKTNPVTLTDDEVAEIVRRRL